MKALFIACDQALYDEVQQNMKTLGVRGYTSWEEVMGCGTATGEPHLGDAVWPMMNSAIISITDDERCWKLLVRCVRSMQQTQSLDFVPFGGRLGEHFKIKVFRVLPTP